MGIMKNGKWLSILIFNVLACTASLRGEEVQWQSQSDDPQATGPAVTLDTPRALPQRPPVEGTPATSPVGGLIPISFEMPGQVKQASGTSPARKSETPAQPEIIAVSAPVTSSSSLTQQGADAPRSPAESAEEQTDTVFAVDRPARAGFASRGNGIILHTSAKVAATTTAAAPPTADVPLVPGWEAPVDASWGAGLPTGPLPEEVDAPPGIFGPGPNPLMPRLYLGAEYLLWWVQGQRVPVLATTSSPNDFGVLGAPSTQALFGGNQINTNPYSGGRFTAGYWFGGCKPWALEISGFFLGPNTTSFVTNTPANPVIGRPFQEANTGQETAQLTSLPGVSTGMLTTVAPSFLWGLQGNVACPICCGCNYRITALAGFRNINLNESLTITENVLGLPTAPPPFTNQAITVTDRFATRNNFYGGNVGVGAWWFRGRWSVQANAQVALGDTVQLLDISGSQHFVSPTGGVQNFTGGLLALNSNIGHFSHNAFSVVPEVGINLGYQVLPYLRAFVGYNFLYWSNVIRPGTSIDRNIDVTRIPNFPLTPEPAPVPGLHPAPVFHEVGLWAQGITFGLQFTY
jgi:hypothetical protein